MQMQDGHRSIIKDVTIIRQSIANSYYFPSNQVSYLLEPAQFQMTVGKAVQSDDPLMHFSMVEAM